MQIAYRAKDITEAHIVAGLLNASGIKTHVGGLYLQGAMGEIGAAGFSNVHVDDEDLYPARQVIAEYEANGQAVPATETVEGKPDSYARWFLLTMAVLALIWLNLR
ncbi:MULTISPECIES: DUF2007 domain-containing protein [Marinobacter]|uniref:DUF2007 domain-containing protein n=1 Tax=Marinobacter xiaoshiensis TaxID=3073652 RepID=A0ABU2HLT7_9GAMM|nr:MULTISPECIES: DUF2007 domain-containing protein [unclassified Marinobacter]MBK1886828.1 DUF2007 domain-containing protein [Marinobacter sp. DY40_1A1]MDS1311728.1 DUF2007 domain-containing protein [Marinobacter sp. F60267]